MKETPYSGKTSVTARFIGFVCLYNEYFANWLSVYSLQVSVSVIQI